VAATVAGIVAIGAVIAVLPRGNDAPSSSPAGQQATPPPPTPARGGGPASGPTVEVSVWIARGATFGAVDALRARLDALVANGSAESVSYVSAAERLEELRGRLRDPSILGELPRNPMPASFEVRTSDAAAVQAAIEGDPAIDRALGVTVHPARVAPRRP
jgi:hypothetical protein